MATKKTTKKPAAKKKAEPKAPPPEALFVHPRSVPANHPIAVSWTDVDDVSIKGPEGTINIDTPAASGSTTWAFAHAGLYVVVATKDGKEAARANVRVR